MNKKYLTGLSVLAVCVLVATGAYAFGGFGKGIQSKEAVQQALEAGDYQAFVEAISKSITEEQFREKAEFYQKKMAMLKAKQEGDFETAKALAEELGINKFSKKKGKLGFYHAKMKGGMNHKGKKIGCPKNEDGSA